MGQLIDFEPLGVASLRRRGAEIEEANQDPVAFARGHSGAVSAIHAAALAAVDAESLDHLIHVVTQLWPGLDAVTLAMAGAGQALRLDASGLHVVARRIVERATDGLATVLLRGVERGHPLFGPACDLIRAEALIRLEGPPPLPQGVPLLGQRRPQGFETRHRAELLVFLGRVVSRMMARWLHP